MSTPAGWLPQVATQHQIETWVLPTIRGERHECYAITEEGAGLGRRRRSGHGPPGRRRVRAQRREVARDFGESVRLLLLPGEAAGRASTRCSSSTSIAGRSVGPHAYLHPHLRPPPPDRGVRGRPGPRREPGRRGRRRDALHPRVVPVRAVDDRRALLRGGRAPDRRGDGLRARASSVRSADRRVPGDPVHAGRLADGAVGGAADDLSDRPRDRCRGAT